MATFSVDFARIAPYPLSYPILTPELPEVEAVVRRPREQVLGALITAVQATRYAAVDVARRAAGQRQCHRQRRQHTS
ncbi:MAG: hypothetical protein IT163_16140 [Bryobacterales bacterium]|nr:hypothetical protein [Bryobacterales bacterium]